MNQLISHIKPEPDEACLSWVLRITEAALLPSPWHLFRRAGLTPSNLGPLRFDAVKLANLLEIDPRMLTGIGCSRSERRAALVVYRDHLIPARQIRGAHPQICPCCVRERGVARASWDLHLVTACTLHRVMLVDRCPGCDQRLSWFRPSVGGCRCGAALADAALTVADEHSLAVSLVLETALMKTERLRDSDPGPGHVAAQDFRALPIVQILNVLRELGRLSNRAFGKTPMCNRRQLVSGAGSILVGWPEQFHVALEEWAAARTSGQTLHPLDKALAIQRAVHAEMLIFRKATRATGAKTDLLEREFLQFLASHATDRLDPRTSKRMQSAAIDQSFVSLMEAANRLETTRATVRELIRKQLIQPLASPGEDPRSVRIPVEQLTPDLRRFKVLSARCAAHLIGFPPEVLMNLRKCGALAHSNKGIRSGSFAERDLLDLLERWRQLPKARPPRHTAVLRLQDLIRRGSKRVHSSWKAELIRRMLERSIDVFEASTSPLDALLRADDIEDIKATLYKDKLSLGDTATALRLTSKGVLMLITQDRLVASLLDDKIRVSIEDVDAFRAEHFRLTSVRRTPVQILEKRCRELGLTVWQTEAHQGRVSYVAADDRELVMSLSRSLRRQTTSGAAH